MNRIVKSGLFAFALAAIAGQSTFAQDAAAGRAPDPKSYGYTVLEVGLATPFSLPWGFDWDIYGLDINFLYSDCNTMDGIEIGGLANVARLNMNGIQLASCCNLANRDATGLTLSAVNLCNGDLCGINIDLVGVNRQVYGLMIDGLGACTDRSFYGLSIANEHCYRILYLRYIDGVLGFCSIVPDCENEGLLEVSTCAACRKADSILADQSLKQCIAKVDGAAAGNSNVDGLLLLIDSTLDAFKNEEVQLCLVVADRELVGHNHVAGGNNHILC